MLAAGVDGYKPSDIGCEDILSFPKLICTCHYFISNEMANASGERRGVIERLLAPLRRPKPGRTLSQSVEACAIKQSVPS